MKNSNFKRFLLLWTGQLISAIGGGLTSFGLGVYVFEKTGSAAGMALVTLLGFLPTLLLSVPAGVLADRYDRRLLMMIGDGFSGIGVLYILICMMRGEASLLQICIGVSVSAVFSSLLDPAYKATVSDLLTADEYSKASGLVSLAGSARYLVSPVIAGILLSVSDIKLLLIIVSSLLTLFIGVFQILAEPMILSIADARTLGIAETICASGIFADWIAAYSGISVGRGAGRVMSFAGVALVIVSVSVLFMKEIRGLEEKPEGEES